ncbi:hypothetical protein L210DRAFT_3642698 [Boletus edulis BED1]|uniref:Uncharacterized protein n=1 Tax=Boletus edulis BED1 TaxID=1328754 RepID=A0AAD4BZT7_BOLED|nr:hypothetical protein L210DRAFT_3642698 [Boletus edulis BED1]
MDSHNLSAIPDPSPLAGVPPLSFSPVPHLSPSLSTSMNSSSLPSPEGDILSHPARLSGAKSHWSNRSQPWARSISPHAASDIPSPPSSCSRDSSPLPSHWTRHVHTRTLAAQQAMARPIHPYNPKSTATPPELRFMTWALGHPSHISMTLEDVNKGKKHFQAVLSAMPDRIIRKAYQAKLAVLESVANRLRLTLSELETLEWRRDYLSAVKEEQDAGLAISSAQLNDVTSVMQARGLQNIEDDGEFYRAAYADDLITLSISNAQLNQARECMLSRPGFCPVPGVGNDAVDRGDQDLNNNNNNNEVEEDKEEEPSGYLYPELPSSDPSEVDII